MYSIAFVAITAAAGVKGDLREGLVWLTQPGTFDEYQNNTPIELCTWSVAGKLTVLVLFSSMGFFGSSCSAAITKQFGALTMSITSTARKAMTLFLSFLLFKNVCTTEHVSGIVLFICALTAKSLRRGRKSHTKTDKKTDAVDNQRRAKHTKKKKPPMSLSLSRSYEEQSVASVRSRSSRTSNNNVVHIV
jgi:hypothetical protein